MKSAIRTHKGSFAVLVTALSLVASLAYAAEPTALTNGVAVTGISGSAGSETFYKIDVPAGQDTLQISTSGGTGDVDLYVRRGAQPTTTSYDYRPYKVGNNETVDVNNPTAGTWYITLRGYSSYSGVTLKATYSAAISIKSLTNDVPATGLSGAASAELYYSIEVPAGQTKLTIAMSGGTGDADLYVKKGALPTTASYDYRPFLSGNNETVNVDTPTAGTWYIMVRGYSAFSAIDLLASYSGTSDGTALSDGVAVTGISGAASSEKVYRIDLPSGVNTLLIEMSGGTGDADLYVRFRTPPTTTEYDYRPFQSGNNETVTVNTPAAGTWFVTLRGYSDYAGVTLRASWGNVTSLQDEVPVSNLSGALDSETFFKIQVPAGQTNLLFTMSGGTGNADMYVRKNAKPTTSNWDYRPTTSGNNESTNISSDNLEGTWYVMLKGTKAYSSVTLVADYSVVETVVALTNGVPVTNLSGVAGTQKFFSLDIPAGTTKCEIRISGGTGDADLYVRRDNKPTTLSYDYRPNLVGNDETVTLDNPSAATWYIMVRGHQSFAGVTLLATYGGSTPDTVTTLQNGVAVTGIAGSANSEKFYKIDVPAGQAKLEVAMSGGTGDADLYVKKGSKPTASDYDYRPYLSGNNETVTINNPAAATWYVLIRGYASFSGVTLKATYTATTPPPDEVTVLTNGVAVTGLSGSASSEKFYKINVPAGQDYLKIETSGGTGDVDLYVKRGAKPTIASWDYRPYLIGNNEQVNVTNPAADTWYILLRGYQAYSGLTLKATYGTNTPPPPTGNIFASDPNCVALWRFESGQLTTDSIGTNTLTNNGVTVDTGDYEEGLASARFTSTAQYWQEYNTLSRADASLSAKFPAKNGTNNKRFSICFWMRADGMAIDPNELVLACKSKSYGIACVQRFNQIILRIATGTGDTTDDLMHGSPIVPQTWYHIAVTFDDGSHTGMISVWDGTAGAVLGTDVQKTNFLPIHIDNLAFVIGGIDGSSLRRGTNGLMDEFVVFNDVLTPLEIAKIRAGTYGRP